MLNYYYETKGNGYYYDKIRINLKITPNKLIKLLPIDELKEESYYFLVSDSSDEARKFGLFATIDMVAPSRKCLEILDKQIPRATTTKISKLEITRDTFFETEQVAQAELNKLLPTIRKKYTSEHFIYDQANEGEKKRKNKSEINEKLFSPVTGYFGSNNFKYVIYARHSKIDDRPCVHAEWRITGASNLKRKTGIISIRDLTNYDLIKFFDEKDKRFIANESIDLTKLGRWILGWTRKKSFSEKALRRMGINGRLFCDAYEIDTYADLVSHFKVVKKKLQDKRGPKTSYQEKILLLSNYGVWRDQ